MKTSVIRVLMVLVSLCILLSVANQLYIQFYSPYQTDVVYEYTFEQQLSAEGVFFKDETTVENGAQGVVKYQQANGSRVAKDAEIARIYPDEETVSAAEQADKLDEQIQQLTAVQSPGAALESNISVINQQLFHTYQNFLTSWSPCLTKNRLSPARRRISMRRLNSSPRRGMPCALRSPPSRPL